MVTVITTKDVSRIYHFLRPLASLFWAENPEKDLASEINETPVGRKYFSINTALHGKLLFLETETVDLSEEQAAMPRILQITSAHHLWNQAVLDNRGSVYFHYSHEDDEGAVREFTVVEAPDGTFLCLGYLPSAAKTTTASIDDKVILSFYWEYDKFRKSPSTLLSSVSIKASGAKAAPSTLASTISAPGGTQQVEEVAPATSVDQWNPTYGRLIPTMLPFLQHNHQYYLITANTPKPIPFSNEFFEGSALLLVNSNYPMNKRYTQRWQNNKNTFEVQLQGKFKKIPAGKLFVGAEITKKMELGIFTRGICKGILQFCESFTSSLHHSFGDKQNTELPHITSPFWSTIDRLVVTNKGDTPPDMFQMFPEDENKRKQRRANARFEPVLNLENTYSFSLKTCNIDLEKWQVVGIPLMKSMDLHTFWSDADIRFCAYSIDAAKHNCPLNHEGLPVLHKQVELERVFSLEIQHASNHPEWASNPAGEYKKANIVLPTPEQEDASAPHSPVPPPLKSPPQPLPARQQTVPTTVTARTPLAEKAPASTAEPELKQQPFEKERTEVVDSDDDVDYADEASEEEDLEEEEEERLYYDSTDGYPQEEAIEDIQVMQQTTIETLPVPPSSTSEMLQHRSASEPTPLETSQFTAKTKEGGEEEPLMRPSMNEPIYLSLAKGETKTIKVQTQQQKSLIDKTNLVVAAIEVDETRPSNVSKRRILYAFRKLNVTKSTSVLASPNPKNLSISEDCVLKSFMEWKEMFPILKSSSSGESQLPLNYSRLIEEEQRRISLDLSYKYLLNNYYLNNTGVAFRSSQTGENPNLMELMEQFLSDRTYTEIFLLNMFQDTLVKDVAKLQRHAKYGALQSEVCLRISNNYYSQEFMYFHEGTQEIIFKDSAKRFNGHKLVIPLKSVSSITLLSPSFVNEANAATYHANKKLLLPLNLPSVATVLISTFSKQYLLLIHESDPNLQNWVNLPNRLNLSPQRGLGAGGFDSMMMNTMELVNDSSHLFHDKAERMILNHRNFTTLIHYKLLMQASNPLVEHVNNPVKFVNTLLEMILTIARLTTSSTSSLNSSELDMILGSTGIKSGGGSSAASGGHSLNQLWVDFLDGVAYLQCVDLSYLLQPYTPSSPSAGKDNASNPATVGINTPSGNSAYDPNQMALTCIYLNLYHCLLIHGYLVLGLPTNLFKWTSFFRNCCYEAFGDVFSLSELEHNIIKAGMSKPSVNFIAKSFIPTTKFSFALHGVQDYRLLWAINPGSVSNIPSVPVYTTARLFEQLDTVTRLSLEQQLVVVNENTAALPQLVQWYFKDFETDLNGKPVNAPATSTSLNNKQLIGVLLKHLSGPLEAQLFAMLEKKTINIKYTSFDFTCRILTKLNI